MAEHRNDATSARQRHTLLVGRQREQIFLREELAAAQSGHGRLVLLGGEAGIGKTALARDLARDAAARNIRVLVGHCYDLTNTPPYGPWLDLVANAPTDPAHPAPPAAFAGGILKRVADQAALFADVQRFFAEFSASGPVVVILEDVHWADPASLELLRHIAHNVAHWPILLLATYRIDALTRHHPLYQQLPALVRESEGLRLDLRRLDVGALRTLASDRYGMPAADEQRLVEYLVRHAEGNPFFTTELLRALEDDAILDWSNGEWTLGELDRIVVPPFLRQVIEGRVGRLGEAVRQSLAIAAVMGQAVSLPLWSLVAELDEASLLATVEQAVEAHLLTARRDGASVRFVHALTREALYEGILPPRRRAWHRQVAEALMAGVAPDVDAVAYHLQQAGDSHAWEWLVQAADRAQRAYAWLTAAERLEAAVDLMADGRNRDLDPRRAQLIHRLGRLYRFSDPESTIRYLDEGERLASRLGHDVLAAEGRVLRGVAFCYIDHFRQGVATIAAAADALEAMPLDQTRAFTPAETWIADALPESTTVDPGDEAVAAEMLHAVGLHFRRSIHPWFLASAGQPAAAIPIGERFVRVLDGAPHSRGGIRSTSGFAWLGLGIAHASLGRPDDARQAFQHARRFFNEYDHHCLVAFTLLNELRDVALSYDTANAARRRHVAAEAEAALARAGGALRPGVSPRLAWLGCLVYDGRWTEALAILRDLPDPANAFLRREVTSATATLARHRGEPARAWEQIQARLPEGPGTEPGDQIHQEGLFLQRMAASLCLDANDLPGAYDWLAAHDRWLAWSECVLGQADGRLSWARVHQHAGENERAHSLATEALALAGNPDQPLVRLAAHRLLGEIATAEDRLAEAEDYLTASLDLATVCETPFERARTLLSIATLRAAQGQTAESSAALDEVRALATTLGAMPTLGEADALAARLGAASPTTHYPAGLTRREVDVLRLVAQRLTDKEVADALFLGTRTVQSHVASILNKLDVANRREAAARAEQLGLL